MGDALNACNVEPAIKTWLLKQLFGTADWMRNQPD